MNMSPSVLRTDMNESSQNKGWSKSHSNLFPAQNEENKEIMIESGKEKSEENNSNNQEELSNYSWVKSNNYEDLKSQNTSSKKNNYNRFFYQKQESESGEHTPRINLEQLDSKDDSLNSSVIRKERNADNFIESGWDENVLNGLSDNEQNLNISSISRFDDSNHSKNNEDSEEDNKDRIISRQPTFSRFSPQPNEDRDFCQNNPVRSMNDNLSDHRSERNLRISDVVIAPMLSSISGSECNIKEIAKMNKGRNNFSNLDSKR